ncbi:response regulator [Paenibacillus sp. PR3]|uniref:Response regulator n=1 Tax=Paenibacillus terricola TaxID=2763503 RepID=A0ABR8MU47_9BACL|nr:response regulator [Paenibacillus terricola]MBD3919483.1 response regulator [Paenibacillus terricola]
MYKVMIVDDEYYFRQALKISLPWGELGYEIAGEAKNGEEALALMTQLSPDVVLVDINMPIMDGLAFIQHVNRSGLSTRFIVLTGQSEFAYAKQAVQLGVFNYVLKPIDEEELRGSLLDIKHLIEKERAERLELLRLQQQAIENVPVLKDRLLHEWLQGHGTAIDSSSFMERLHDWGIELYGPCYRVIVIDIDPITNFVSGENNKQVYKHAVQDIVQPMIPSLYSSASCYDPDGRFVMIIGSASDSFEQMETICETVRTSVQTNLPCTVTIGVGNGYLGMESIAISYKEALYALKHRFIGGGNQVIVHSRLTQSGMKASLFSIERRSSLLMCLRIGNQSETETWITDFFQDALAKKASMEMLLVSGLEMVSTCLEFLDEMSQTDQIYQDAIRSDILQTFQEMNAFSQLESWIRNLILNVMAHVHEGKQTRAVKIVEEVKSYILNHYGNEELRIEEMAKSVHMNYNHLCYVFKKETSITINDYLTELRIAKAKELFDQGVKVVQYVASQVGYADANYFSKCFKKYIGITPSKYINHIQ